MRPGWLEHKRSTEWDKMREGREIKQGGNDGGP